MITILCVLMYLIVIALSYVIQFRLSQWPDDTDEAVIRTLGSIFWPFMIVVYSLYGVTKLFLYLSYKIFPKKGE